ncbi:hypothetical protein GH741_01535 [Aquibacillus halophilus]|uniref:Lipoprotein n=1 Tax=Aquibacillus halophilus TaxID=930132 RepID=A0A6A8DJ56_9BACI|nr:DUF6376 family protein [Aquibacillus halophilus]MRH41352.1 hypothetical protein [Aquibacillus halophilus]
MKKIFGSILLIMVLSGCSFLGEVNESIDYTEEATTHINNLSDFAENAPQMIEDAANDPAAREELASKLQTLKEEVEAFNLVDPPSIAKDIHESLVNKNEILLDEINKVLENGKLAVEQLENSEIVKTINEASDLLDRIKNIGL